MIDTFLEILYQVDEGQTDPDEIAAMAGLTEAQTYALLEGLRSHGFLVPSTSDDVPTQPTGFVVSAAGRNFLRQGAEEVFKRTWSERLGGEESTAS